MTTLIEELQKPEYASLVEAKDYAGLEAVFNARNISAPKKGTFITELGVLDLLGATDGDAFLTAMENATVAFPVLARIVRWLRSEKGVDIGNPEVQQFLTTLAGANVIDTESASDLIAYGTETITLAEQLNLGVVGMGALVNAIKEMESE